MSEPTTKLIGTISEPKVLTNDKTLQCPDSALMLSVLRAANEQKIPVLPAHDEIWFPRNHSYAAHIPLLDDFREVLIKKERFIQETSMFSHKSVRDMVSVHVDRSIVIKQMDACAIRTHELDWVDHYCPRLFD